MGLHRRVLLLLLVPGGRIKRRRPSETVKEPLVSPGIFGIALTAVQNNLTQFRRCGRGVLRGAAFRQRPLSRLLLNVLAGTRTLPPEGTALKDLWRAGIHAWNSVFGGCGHHFLRVPIGNSFPALIRLALAGDVRATFPQGKAWETDCRTSVCTGSQWQHLSRCAGSR